MLTLKLLFTSDEHGHIRQAPRIQNLIEKEKAENPNTLLLSSGDIFQGTADSDLLGGKPSLDIVKEAGYDLVELGNHDFDNGVDFVKDWLAHADYPVLAGNVVEESTGKLLPGAKPYQIFQEGDVKIGLIGVLTPETLTASRPDNVKGLQILDPVDTVKRIKKELQEQGVDVVGVVSHLGLDGDRELASKVDGLDFILGGHTHKALLQPEKINNTLVCQPGCFRDYLGSLELQVDEKTGHLAGFNHRLIPVSEGQEAPSAVSTVVEQARQKLDSATSTVVSESNHPLQLSHVRESSLEYEITEAMREVSGAPLAMINLKAQRADIPQGDVTAGDLYNALPFPNDVVKMKIPRAELLEALKLSDERADHTSLTSHHSQLYFDKQSRPDGGLDFLLSDFKLDDDPNPESPYVEVATLDFLADGGLGYFHNPEVVAKYGSVRDVLEKRLDEHLPEGQAQLKEHRLSSKEVFESLKR